MHEMWSLWFMMLLFDIDFQHLHLMNGSRWTILCCDRATNNEKKKQQSNNEIVKNRIHTIKCENRAARQHANIEGKRRTST